MTGEKPADVTASRAALAVDIDDICAGWDPPREFPHSLVVDVARILGTAPTMEPDTLVTKTFSQR